MFERNKLNFKGFRLPCFKHYLLTFQSVELETNSLDHRHPQPFNLHQLVPHPLLCESPGHLLHLHLLSPLATLFPCLACRSVASSSASCSFSLLSFFLLLPLDSLFFIMRQSTPVKTWWRHPTDSSSIRNICRCHSQGAWQYLPLLLLVVQCILRLLAHLHSGLHGVHGATGLDVTPPPGLGRWRDRYTGQGFEDGDSYPSQLSLHHR